MPVISHKPSDWSGLYCSYGRKGMQGLMLVFIRHRIYFKHWICIQTTAQTKRLSITRHTFVCEEFKYYRRFWTKKSIYNCKTFTLEHIAALFNEIDINLSWYHHFEWSTHATEVNRSFCFNTLNGSKHVTDSIRLYSALVLQTFIWKTKKRKYLQEVSTANFNGGTWTYQMCNSTKCILWCEKNTVKLHYKLLK